MADIHDHADTPQHGSEAQADMSTLNKISRGPTYSGARADHRVWAFKAQSFLATKNLFTLCKGERDGEQLSIEDKVREAYQRDNERLFDNLIQMVDTKPVRS